MHRVTAIVLVFAAACQQKTECKPEKSKEEWLCTPGANVFCRCDGDPNSSGTKKCGCDGESFAECVCTASSASQQITPSDPDPPVTTRPRTGPVGTTNVTPPTDQANTCPGALVPVDGGQTSVVHGDTGTATADYAPATGACAVAAGKDQVYEVISTDSGKLTVEMIGDGDLDPTLYVREGDCASGPQRACGETTGVAANEVVRFNVIAGHKYYVFADGKGSTSGTYKLNISVEPGSFCGDGVVDPGEACDDGNKTDNDGCSNACKPDGTPSVGATCPGQPVHVWPGPSQTYQLSTTTYASLSSPTSMSCTQGDGPNRMLAVVAHGSGTLTAMLDPAFDGVLYARSGKCDGAELQCSDAYSNGPETLTFAVTSGTTYWLIVDGAASPDKGDFGLTLSLP